MGLNGEGMPLLHAANRLEEHIHRPRITEQRLASVRDSGKEITSTCHSQAPIPHGFLISRVAARNNHNSGVVDRPVIEFARAKRGKPGRFASFARVSDFAALSPTYAASLAADCQPRRF
jgi:hypothetical protein